jgi:hypothetical protein
MPLRVRTLAIAVRARFAAIALLALTACGSPAPGESADAAPPTLDAAVPTLDGAEASAPVVDAGSEGDSPPGLRVARQVCQPGPYAGQLTGQYTPPANAPPSPVLAQLHFSLAAVLGPTPNCGEGCFVEGCSVSNGTVVGTAGGLPFRCTMQGSQDASAGTFAGALVNCTYCPPGPDAGTEDTDAGQDAGNCAGDALDAPLAASWNAPTLSLLQGTWTGPEVQGTWTATYSDAGP